VNGEWAMENGEWAMENGEWGIENTVILSNCYTDGE